MLQGINSPGDLRRHRPADLKQIAEELRAETIEAVSVTGGHLGAGLGVVELTIALHYIFDTPKDRLIWTSDTKRILINLTGRQIGFARCGPGAAFRASPNDPKANTTRSAPPMHRPRFQPPSAWRWRAT